MHIERITKVCFLICQKEHYEKATKTQILFAFDR